MDIAEFKTRVADVVTIPVTPFTTDGEVDLSAYETIVARMGAAGITVFTPNGNTGEYYSLTSAERVELVRRTRSAAPSSLVISGVGNSAIEAAEEARAAVAAGADAIMIHQPVHPFSSSEGWVDYHVAVANAVPETGVIIYARDERISAGMIERFADRSANFGAVKFALHNTSSFASIARQAGLDRLVWIAGLAELTAPSYWSAGSLGFTSGLANVVPELSLSMIGHLRAGDYESAMLDWDRARAFEKLRWVNASQNNVSVIKEALHVIGLCQRTVRPPISELDSETARVVAEIVKDWGIVA